MKYVSCDALAVISSMWGRHFKSAVSVTPSSRAEFTCSIGRRVCCRWPVGYLLVL